MTPAEAQRQRTALRRQAFFEMYGWTCVCCGESNLGLLTLEHKLNDAKKPYQGYTEMKRAISEYRPDLFEVRCYNCNCSQKWGNPCPHTMYNRPEYEI